MNPCTRIYHSIPLDNVAGEKINFDVLMIHIIYIHVYIYINEDEREINICLTISNTNLI